ncbi:MAG: hypothetical protein KAX78_04990, partial [Phycisphaerae bacterium]|nr:hypothetical protein [Phycisphaerae bacterium]
MADVTFIVDGRWGAHVRELLDERAQDRLAALPARLAVAVAPMGDDELDGLIAGYQAPNDRVRSYKHLRAVLAKDSFGIRAGGRTEAGVPLIEVRAADIRGVLYGAFELIEKLRRGEDVASIDLIEVPDLPIRINYEFLTVSQRLSRSANRRRIVDFFRKEAFYLRFNGIYPAVSNGRAILPIGYPHYADRRCLKSEYFQELQLIYDQCVHWGLDFYCPVNLIPLPVAFEPLIGSQMSTHLSCLKFSDRAEGVRWLKEHFGELFTADGKLDIGNRAFENMLRAQLTFALECFPQMKGVNVYPCEDGQYNVVMGRSYGGLDLAIDPQRDYGRFFRCIADAIGPDRQMF